jgi:hypothetical protein
MSASLSLALRNARLDRIPAALGASGLLRIYSGSRPAGPDTAPSGGNVLLAELALANPAAPPADNATLTFSTIAQDPSANATGSASWFRLATGVGAGVLDGDVGETGAPGAELTLNTVALVAGGPVQVTSFVVTE